MKDLMRKLVYSLEQLSLQHLDSKQNDMGIPSTQSNNLAIDSKNIQAVDLNNTMEVIMMKRMNFIRNSLETHDPK